MKQLTMARKQVKLMAKQYGRASQQYKDAISHQADLVLKHITHHNQ
jgi:F0F1-type ATP synthase membrane subunit b/b'